MAAVRLPRLSARSVEIGELLDAFLVCAVGTILVIRLQLYLTNYPQLGGGGLHIAHVLDGGLLMMIAIVIAVSFLTRSARQVAAVVGGIGFGFFIDELGKFITEDTNYFYKPTAALIYILFILMYLGFRALQRRRGFTKREYLVNAIELIKEAAIHDLDEAERRRAMEMLDHADPADPLVEPVRELIRRADAIPTPEPTLATRTVLRLRDLYVRTVQRPGFVRVMNAIFVLLAIGSLIQILTLVFIVAEGLGGESASALFADVFNKANDLSFISYAALASSVVSGVFTLVGVYRLRTATRLSAYRMFDRALLVNIYVTQVFAFAKSEFSAVFGLGVYLLVWVTLRYMMGAERRVALASGAVPAAATEMS
jgi:hypothetical protein